MITNIKNYFCSSNFDCKRFFDIVKKLFLFFYIISICVLFLNVNNFNLIASNIDINVNFVINRIYYEILLGILLILIIAFKELLLSSNYNNTKIEKSIHNILNKIPKFKINNKLYVTTFLLILLIFYSVFFDILNTISLISNFTTELNYSTMDYLPIKGFGDEKSLFIIIPLVFSFFILVKPKDKINRNFTTGCVLFFVSMFIINYNMLKEYNEILIENGEYLKDSINNYLYLKISGIIFVVMFLLFNIKYLIEKNFITNLFNISLGYILSFILVLTSVNLIQYTKNNQYLSQNLNDRNIIINDKNYNYNTSPFLMHNDQKDDQDFELLIESYAGQGMHNSSFIFQYIFSNNFKGDKERAYHLFSKIYKNNSIIIKENKVKAYNILDNEVNAVDLFHILIPYILEEVSPYESTKRTLDNVLNKDYQAAVDNYIEYGLNSDFVVVSRFTKKEIETGFFGDDIYREMIYSLVSNGYAKFDLEKVKNDKYRKKWEIMLKNKPSNYNKTLTITNYHSTTESNRQPRNFRVQFSTDNGLTWNTMKSFTGVSSWAASEKKTFSLE